jgi:hypothetical protein
MFISVYYDHWFANKFWLDSAGSWYLNYRIYCFGQYHESWVAGGGKKLKQGFTKSGYIGLIHMLHRKEM